MYNTSLRIIGNQADAEDIMQESFLDAFRKIDTYNEESSFGAWLKRIVINTCINAIKKRKADLMYTDEIYHFDNVKHDEERQELPVTTKDIEKAMEQLPDGGRTVFSLYLLEGYDHQEIAQILNITEVSSRSQVFRGKNKLKELLKKYNYA
jgi:RNA polymerase sigma-70 factor (ECF subfamily)